MKKTQQRSKWKNPDKRYGLRFVGDRVFAVKVLENDGSGPWSGHDWPLPDAANGQPGKWVNVRGQLIPCQRGVHGAQVKDAGKWLGVEADLAGCFPDPYRRLFVIELREVYTRKDDNKLIARRGRILREVKLRKRTWFDPKDIRLAVEVARNKVKLAESQAEAKRGQKKAR